ncbi:AmpG family muropeptide MFS transporter [Moraxella oblonga]|uniref:AmpG family muropeptide MFS transporter n=1 Tax=Moraxella oblonga TaxID=200413 RepID=UPI000835326F|nr:MFS transporter [Moraxella oblonga]
MTTSNSAFRTFAITYFNRQALSLLFLGFSAGVPIVLLLSSLGLWLREAGIERSTVTMFGYAGLGYSFKFIWSPLADSLPLPILTKWLGQRRAWLLFSQILMIMAIIIMAMTNPQGENLAIMAMGAVLLGFSAATQDIAIDAYRIESAPSDMQTALSATYVAGYRIGMIVSGAGALYLADFFGSTKEMYSYLAWQKTYLIMACIMGVAVATTLVIKEPKFYTKKELRPTSDYLRLLLVFICAIISFIATYRFLGGVLPKVDDVLASFMIGSARFLSSGVVAFGAGFMLVQFGVVDKKVAHEMWIRPLTDFFERYGKKALMLLALIGLYRISDIVVGNISNIFYQDLGFSKSQIATAVKTFGVIAAIGGGFFGGTIAQKIGVMKAMFVGALLACATNLLFIMLFYTPTGVLLVDKIVSLPLLGERLFHVELKDVSLYVAVLTDNMASGLASAVFVAFLSALTSIRFTAVQYALFSSLMTLSPKILGGYSGAIVDKIGYPKFFMITFIIGLPILYLIYMVHKKIPLQLPDDKK